MSKRGRISIEDRIGPERFKSLLTTYPDVADISELVCDHEIGKEEKRKCEACRRAIYRAKERLTATEREDKTFQPIDNFSEIPEIKAFIEYQKAKGVQSLPHIQRLFRMWTWIKDSGKNDLVESQRPIIWTDAHIQHIRIKLDEEHIAIYSWIQTLRHFFLSAKRPNMLQNILLKARRRDMRSPNGASRAIDRFTPKEFTDEILPMLNKDEQFIVKMHVSLKSREGDQGKGSLLGLKWSDINFEDTFYGFPIATAKVFEPKTAGGTTWEHCPIDFWFQGLSEELKTRFLASHSSNPYVFSYTQDQYQNLWTKISVVLKKDFEPHDCRRSPSGWLRDLTLSDLAIGQYDARTGKAVGFAGVGWENAEIFFQRYGKMNPLAIYDKSKRMDVSMFNGLVNKILEAKK
jgi:integrase